MCHIKRVQSNKLISFYMNILFYYLLYSKMRLNELMDGWKDHRISLIELSDIKIDVYLYNIGNISYSLSYNFYGSSSKEFPISVSFPIQHVRHTYTTYSYGQHRHLLSLLSSHVPQNPITQYVLRKSISERPLAVIGRKVTCQWKKS